MYRYEIARDTCQGVAWGVYIDEYGGIKLGLPEVKQRHVAYEDERQQQHYDDVVWQQQLAERHVPEPYRGNDYDEGEYGEVAGGGGVEPCSVQHHLKIVAE